MRIIAGELRGRRLKTVEGRLTRPTADKIKGAVFNVLGDRPVGATVLDLFAGTGNLALEALSRGAEQAVLVESASAAVKVIAENICLTQMQDMARLLHMDAMKYLEQHKNQVFDLIFLDPPYRQALVDRALELLAEPCRLSPHGVIVAETARGESIRVNAPFEIRKTGLYGDTLIWYLQRTDI